jgi:hypothetical protein
MLLFHAYIGIARYMVEVVVHETDSDSLPEGMRVIQAYDIDGVQSDISDKPLEVVIGTVDGKAREFQRTHIVVDRLQERRQSRFVIPLPTRTNDELVVAGGVIAIIGGTAAGKTVLLNQGILPSFQHTEHYTYMEDPIYARTLLVGTPHSLLAHIAHYVAIAAMGGQVPVIAADSFREFMYLAGEGTGEGGLNMNIPVQITALSNLLEQVGILMFATINPLLDSESRQDQFLRLVRNFEASATGTLMVQLNTQSNERVLSWSTRGRLNPTRPVGSGIVRELITASIEDLEFQDNSNVAPITQTILDSAPRASSKAGSYYERLAKQTEIEFIDDEEVAVTGQEDQRTFDGDGALNSLLDELRN